MYIFSRWVVLFRWAFFFTLLMAAYTTVHYNIASVPILPPASPNWVDAKPYLPQIIHWLWLTASYNPTNPNYPFKAKSTRTKTIFSPSVFPGIVSRIFAYKRIHLNTTQHATSYSRPIGGAVSVSEIHQKRRGTRFQKASFSGDAFTVLVWTIGQNDANICI